MQRISFEFNRADTSNSAGSERSVNFFDDRMAGVSKASRPSQPRDLQTVTSLRFHAGRVAEVERKIAR